MKVSPPQFREVGADNRRIAFRRRMPTQAGTPGVVWLGGFKSDMDSTKATVLDAHCEQAGRAFLRFDYSGHGLSGGDFTQGTVSRWLEETLDLIVNETEGPQLIVGSSMGGYLALLTAKNLPPQKGFVLIAPAADFTEALLWANLPDEAKRAIETEGLWRRPSAYSPEPYVYTRALIEDGRKHLLLGGEIRTHAPVRILQGMKDPDVPYTHALKLMEHLNSDEATLTLIKDGDHRLSRPQDLETMLQAVDAMCA